MDPQVAAFVAEHDDAEALQSGKIRCKTTEHEIPPRLELLEQHWSGKVYRNKQNLKGYDFKQHEPWLVPHKKSVHLLWCTLTEKPLSKQPKTVQGHVDGKKFKRLLAAAKAKEEADEAAAAAEGEEGEEFIEEGEDAM